MLRAGAGLLALLSLAALPASAARGCGPAVVHVTVLDRFGIALNGLAPADFRVRIRNSNAAVTAMNYGVVPHATLVLVSRTGSMSETLKLELAKRLTAAVVASAPGAVSVGAFGSDVSGLQDARAGQSFIAGAQSPDDSMNRLYDAALAGLENAVSHRGDAIVIITDSPDRGSVQAIGELRQRLALTGVRLFLVPLPPATNSGPMQSVSEVADSSGGEVIVPLGVDASTTAAVISLDQLDSGVATFTKAYTQAANVYQLETDQDAADRQLPLHVEVDRKKLGNGKVMAPAMLAPCSANAR